MAGILVLGTSGGSSILPSPTIIRRRRPTDQGTELRTLRRRFNSFRLHHFLLYGYIKESEALMREVTKNVVTGIREKRMGWITS